MKSILVAVAEFLFLAVLMIAITVSAKFDARIILQGASELTILEFAQEALILLSATLFGVSAVQRPEARGFLVLVAGLFGCMFIRELDFFLDKIMHGFWLYPASLLAIVSIVIARICNGTVLIPMAAFTGTRSHGFLTTGLLIVLVFSRFLGSGSLWSEVMSEDYQWAYKTVLQEALELSGYLLVAYGSFLAYQAEPHIPTRNHSRDER